LGKDVLHSEPVIGVKQVQSNEFDSSNGKCRIVCRSNTQVLYFSYPSMMSVSEYTVNSSSNNGTRAKPQIRTCANATTYLRCRLFH
jgi:hypothetical protein